MLERVQRTNGGSYVVWLDNLFTTQRLLSFLRDRGIGAAGTARTNSNIDYRLAKLKELLSTVDKIPWGQLYCAVSEDKKVIEFGWKDHGLVLFMSTVSNGKGMVNRRRRRPRTTATSAKATRAVFGNRVVIILPIPDFINLYNHCINGVNKADQLRSYYFTQRIHRKGWKALWHFLLNIAITNSYKLYLHAPNHRDAHHDHKHFRKALVTALLRSAERTYIKPSFNTAPLIKAVNPLANKHIMGKR